MSGDLQLRVRATDAESSLILSSARSSLVARGRRDAAMLTAGVETESEAQRCGLYIGDHRVARWDTTLCDIGDTPQFEELLKRADDSDARYQNWLASSCRYGPGKDLTQSLLWYRKAANQGYAPAQFNLGWWFDSNYPSVPGIEQDYAEAAAWYRKAADQGLAPAQFNIGSMFDTGEGVARNYAEAVKWYRKAADQGLAPAQFNLGLKYAKGQGVARDFTEAVRWFRKAADQRDPALQFSLGMRYANGRVVARDLVQAYMWMDLAISHAGVDEGKLYAAERDKVAANMSSSQIDEAQRLAGEWKPTITGAEAILNER